LKQNPPAPQKISLSPSFCRYNCFVPVTIRHACENKKHILHRGVSISLAELQIRWTGRRKNRKSAQGQGLGADMYAVHRAPPPRIGRSGHFRWRSEDVYASSLREPGLHRSCNRAARRDVGQDCLNIKDMSGEHAWKGCSLVDVVDPCLPISLNAMIFCLAPSPCSLPDAAPDPACNAPVVLRGADDARTRHSFQSRPRPVAAPALMYHATAH
jgi:hypothetical protein